jgi:branched-chain amino acid transport system ATP-binding protein
MDDFNPEYQLEVQRITLSFGGLMALSGVSFGVKKGEIFAIIGPNGAGKTCVLNCICRFYKPQSGKVFFEGRDISRLATHRVAARGIARSFQNIELFKGMTVLDNIKLGRHVHMKTGLLSGGVYWGWAFKARGDAGSPGNRRAHHRPSGNRGHPKKGGGHLALWLQKRVELARALAMKPKILLLDEPMAGMNLEETEDMARFILDVNEEWGVTVVLIEHDMGVVMDFSDNVVVLDFGNKIAQGRPRKSSKNPHVIRGLPGRRSRGIIPNWACKRGIQLGKPTSRRLNRVRTW